MCICMHRIFTKCSTLELHATMNTIYRRERVCMVSIIIIHAVVSRVCTCVGGWCPNVIYIFETIVPRILVS